MAYYDRLLECVNGDETVKRLFPEYVTCLQEAYEELDTRFQGAVKSVLVAKIKRGNVLMDNLYVVFKRKVRLLGRLAENQSEKDMAETLLNLLEASNVACGRRTIGILRTTYLVNEEGIIEKIFTPKEIKTKIHAEQILDYIK